jgi:hypothetical protein
MREHALSLARQGFKVFPIKANCKEPPLVMGWQLCATTDEAQVHAWWASWPDANVGIHCVDHIVVDIDPRHNGDKTAEFLEDIYGFPPTRKVLTPGGGHHLYYKSDKALPNKPGLLGEGVDVRSKGGYVLAPGSAVNGVAYTLSDAAPVADAPEWLRAWAPAAAEKIEQAPAAVNVNQDIAESRAREWLGAQDIVEAGRRNHEGYAAAAMCRDFGLSEDRTYLVLASDWKCEPPLDAAELHHVVHSAFRYAQQPAASLSPEAMFKQVEEVIPAPKQGIVASTRRLLHPSRLDFARIIDRDYIVKGLLSPNSKAEIFGKWGSGKTFLMLSLGAHVALGLPWFDHKVRQTGVLNLMYEGADGMSLRLMALAGKLPQLKEPTVPFECELMVRNLGHQDGRSQAHAALHGFKNTYGAYPGLVIVDPLRNAIGNKEDPEHIAPYLEWCKQLLDEARICVLMAHHPGHGDGERGRGDSGLEGDMDTVLKVDGDAQTVEVKKQRDGTKGKFGYALEVVTLGKDRDGDDVTTCVAVPRALDEAGELSETQQRLYDTAVSCVKDGGIIKRQEIFDAAGVAKNSFDGAWRSLVQKHLIFRVKRDWKVDMDSAAAALAGVKKPSIDDML